MYGESSVGCRLVDLQVKVREIMQRVAAYSQDSVILCFLSSPLPSSWYSSVYHAMKKTRVPSRLALVVSRYYTPQHHPLLIGRLRAYSPRLGISLAI